MTILSAERSLFRSHIASTGKDRKKKVLLSRGAIIMQSTATIYLPSSSEEKRDDGKEKQEKVWRKNTTGGTHPTDERSLTTSEREKEIQMVKHCAVTKADLVDPMEAYIVILSCN